MVHRVVHVVSYLTNPCELPSGFLVEFVENRPMKLVFSRRKPRFPEMHHPRRCLMKKSQMFRIAQIIGGVGAAVAVFAAPLKWW